MAAISHAEYQTSARVHKARAEFAGRREWSRGLRSAGSVFKNPPNQSAGRLIEEAGLKGVSIGGATISPAHANVITTTSAARASDVLALMDLARAAVRRRTGTALTPEVVVME